MYTLHKPVHCHFKRSLVVVGDIDELWLMDLADMQSMHMVFDTCSFVLTFSSYKHG